MIDKYQKEIIFFGAPSDRKDIDKIRELMKNKSYIYTASLKKAFYMIRKCPIFVSNDTGPMHIAAAQGCKTIGLFGPNTPSLWAPYGKENISIFKPNLNEAMIQNDKGIFPDKNTSILNIEINDVLEAFNKLNKK